jgi:hypothetical protein
VTDDEKRVAEIEARQIAACNGVHISAIKFIGSDIPWLIACLRASEAELARLREALPVTADGVTVVPGMTVWKFDKIGILSFVVGGSILNESEHPWWLLLWDKSGGVSRADECYSTKEAAARAAQPK